jgi:transcriptional regulator with GAF, ATPase, and Fis domain
MREEADATPVLADLLGALAAIGQSMQEKFDPHRFLDAFAGRIRGLVPHDRLVLSYLEDDGRSFSVFAEHAGAGPAIHEAHYTTAFNPEGRYPVEEWAIRPVFAGEAMRVDDFRADPRFARRNPYEQRIGDAGFRAGLLVPLAVGGRVVGALALTSLTPGTYTPAHEIVARQVADLIAPFIENAVLLQRERRRRRRLRDLQGLIQALGASLDVGGVFARLAESVRPVLDFDVMGVCRITESGRDVEVIAEVDDAHPAGTMPPRLPLEHFSFADATLRGEHVLIRDAQAELDPARPGDRLVIGDGGRSLLCVPLVFAERIGGALYLGKRRPCWYDRSDVEIARGVAAQLVLALQHQRLAEEARRVALAEGRARQLEARLASLRHELDERYGWDRILGRSPALREALTRAARVAPTETTVLITGESGTGKELVARAIHHASARADGPFVAINCAALPETLLESELFGHERGAFTGADRQKPGRFELARGGTLFLDEIGELSHAVQVKLLRVLQEREFERVGGTSPVRADVRVITATNRDLPRLVAEGRFREDLYYRLEVFTVHLPPLRERGDDILLLADHFVRALGARMGRGEPGLSRGAREALLAYRWPGNIRELQNAVERALIMAEGGLLGTEHLGLPGKPLVPGTASGSPPGPADTPAGAEAEPGSLAEWESRMVRDALTRARGNKSRAAQLLGLTRSQLYTRLKRFGLEP